MSDALPPRDPWRSWLPFVVVVGVLAILCCCGRGLERFTPGPFSGDRTVEVELQSDRPSAKVDAPVFERRFADLRVDAVVRWKSSDRLSVVLDGISRPETLLDITLPSGQLEVREVRREASDGFGVNEIVGRQCPRDGQGYCVYLVLGDTLLITNSDIRDLEAGEDADGGYVTISLHEEGAARFARASADLVGRQLALVLDGDVMAAATLREPIPGGSLRLLMGDDPDSAGFAQALAHRFASGRLEGRWSLVSIEDRDPTPFTPPPDGELAPPWGATGAPQLVLTNAVTFRDGRTMDGASSFLIQDGDAILLATALHLLGPAGGLDPMVPLARLDAELSSWSAFVRTQPVPSVSAAGLAMATLDPQMANDWLVLRTVATDTLPSTPLKLRSTPVALGERVWLVGCEYRDSSCKQAIVGGRVSGRRGTRFRYDLDKPVALAGFSGAPVLDARGLVVGVMSVWFTPHQIDGEYLEGGGMDASALVPLLQASGMNAR